MGLHGGVQNVVHALSLCTLVNSLCNQLPAHSSWRDNSRSWLDLIDQGSSWRQQFSVRAFFALCSYKGHSVFGNSPSQDVWDRCFRLMSPQLTLDGCSAKTTSVLGEAKMKLGTRLKSSLEASTPRHFHRLGEHAIRELGLVQDSHRAKAEQEWGGKDCIGRKKTCFSRTMNKGLITLHFNPR